jgi:hypothetical protein
MSKVGSINLNKVRSVSADTYAKILLKTLILNYHHFHSFAKIHTATSLQRNRATRARFGR